MKSKKPLVYSCSGCSSAAQLANALALSLDHSGEFEMSCIAGVGAKLRNFVKQAQDSRAVLCIDGCSLQCARRCLNAVEVDPEWHFVLSDHEIEKRKHDLPSSEEVIKATKILRNVIDSGVSDAKGSESHRLKLG